MFRLLRFRSNYFSRLNQNVEVLLLIVTAVFHRALIKAIFTLSIEF